MLEIYTLLNPKVANLNGTGGIPAITPEDVSFCLAKIKERGPSLLIRAQLMDDVAYREMRVLFRQHVAHLAMLKHWKTGPKFADYFEGLCDSVLHFYMNPRICYRCNGRTEVRLRTGQVIDCPLCTGRDEHGEKVNKIEPMERDKARAAGIPIETWRDVWADRYLAARDILLAWDGEADRIVRRLWWE